jgi:hypothetical protein
VLAVRRKAHPTAALVIWSAAVLHSIEAGIIIWTPNADSSIGMASYLATASDRRVLSVLMLAASASAVVGAFKRNLTAIFALLPQQTMLCITAVGALYFAVAGHYADGYVPNGGGVFILADQLPRVLLCLLHSVAFYQWINAPDLAGVPLVAQSIIEDAVYLGADGADADHIMIATEDLREIVLMNLEVR